MLEAVLGQYGTLVLNTGRIYTRTPDIFVSALAVKMLGSKSRLPAGVPQSQYCTDGGSGAAVARLPTRDTFNLNHILQNLSKNVFKSRIPVYSDRSDQTMNYTLTVKCST